MLTRRILTTVGAALVLGVSGTALPATTTSASGGEPAAAIIGGSSVTDAQAPWGAAVYLNGEFYCSGTIIAPTWVLTAAECLGANLTVRVGNVIRKQATEIEVEDVRTVPMADIALLRLATAYETTYAQLADNDPPVGSINQICGWGAPSFNIPPTEDLRCGTVRVTVVSGTCTDTFDGPAICSVNDRGVAWRGDDGGPQFYEGRQVGVCSWKDGRWNQKYTSVAANRDWIRSVAGV
ncbi:DUF1986 domain-containing protein [Actinomadura spongiicola]|uniref:DUF1986 domain-containing protein n=1 Tax=Actinomadura spongiicola TaxID=2303421 RepID=A0A372GNE2_9ACTN|nr:DUF1986 domain-containing protein [Actinomadura spongiicola]RFS86573.1 DUF1986 domain-containing protein [Actinomadura spongiicola]